MISGVAVREKDNIGATSSLRGMFAETDTVQVIVRPPSYERTLLNIVKYDSRLGDLAWKEDTFRSFPVHGVNNFKTLRQRPELCFFDKTAFIMALESFSEPVLVFLRPRRSGKSLGLSTLAHFHGREHLPDYKPLFELSNEYPVPIDSVQWKPPRRSNVDNVLEGFWASVKSGLGYREIAKCYITGVSPQSLVDNTSGLNVVQYVSWGPELASFCGLTGADVCCAGAPWEAARSYQFDLILDVRKGVTIIYIHLRRLSIAIDRAKDFKYARLELLRSGKSRN
ncbi:hypothetical protein BGZ79_010387 [Entomortierella chlamydospora]|nr:hypothetical protein BGZ79_010387 [Entomortierella chlamydospora]